MPKPPLHLHTVLRSTDLDETRDLVWRHMGQHPIEPVSPAGEVNARINGRTIDQVAAAYMTFGAEMRTHPGEIEHYILQIPLTGEYCASINGNEVNARLGLGVATSPRQDISTWWSADCGLLTLRIDEANLREHLITRFGVRVTDPLQFQPVIELAGGPMRDFYVRLLAPLLRRLNNGDMSLDHVPSIIKIEEMLLTALLTSQPHTYSSRLNGNRGTASAWP